MAVTIQSPGMVIRNLLDDSPAQSIGEAPADGFTYARRNGVWVDITNEIAGNNLYIQDAQPTDSGSCLWIQTNVNENCDFSFWFNQPN